MILLSFSRQRKFEFSPAPIEVERRRQRLQCCTDVCSTMFLIPGILIAIITPISLIPMFILPLKYYIPLIAVFIVSGIVAVLSLAMSGLTGNIVWHYDPDKQRLRPRLHCGKGPLLHFWGNGFYPSKEDKQPLNGEKIVWYDIFEFWSGILLTDRSTQALVFYDVVLIQMSFELSVLSICVKLSNSDNVNISYDQTALLMAGNVGAVGDKTGNTVLSPKTYWHIVRFGNLIVWQTNPHKLWPFLKVDTFGYFMALFLFRCRLDVLFQAFVSNCWTSGWQLCSDRFGNCKRCWFQG